MSSLPNTERLVAERDRGVAAGTAGRPFFAASASGARITDVHGRAFIHDAGGAIR